MSPSLIHSVTPLSPRPPGAAPARAAFAAGEPAMTVGLIRTSGPRTDALTARAYSLPVVRELPLQLGDPVGDRAW